MGTPEHTDAPPRYHRRVPFLLLEPVVRRLQVSEAADRDPISLFMEAMGLAECVLKAAVASVVAGIRDDSDRYRYRYEYTLVRASGIGEWHKVLQEVLTGPAYALLAEPFQEAVNSLNKSYPTGDRSWQCRSTEKAIEALRVVRPEVSAAPKVRAQQWPDYIAMLRNRTRGHGALTQTRAAQMWPALKESVLAFAEGFPLFQAEWAYLHRNNSGKFRVVPISDCPSSLDYLKSSTQYNFTNGVHIPTDDGRPVPVSLIVSDLDLSDFWFANGGLNERDLSAEWLSYASDTTLRLTADAWRQMPTALPGSQTDGAAALEVQGEVFGNLPPAPENYVERPTLEAELRARLEGSDWHRVITLVGPGGVGKTTMTLTVLHRLAQDGPYKSMVWFSSRDIDLTERGPISVRPRVLTVKDIGRVLWSFLETNDPPKGFDREDYLSRQLQSFELGPCLFVFDNFETIEQPAAVYEWLNAHVGPENKVLITTRLRTFKGDYPVEVTGMTRPEFERLVKVTGERLGITDRLTASIIDDLFAVSEGHPYVTKVLLGHIAIAGTQGVGKIISSRQEVLQALFERSFKQLTPLAQRTFLTLCGWRSAVPRLAIEAVLTRSASPDEIPDTSGAVDQLLNYSLIELFSGHDESEFVRVPSIARAFGLKKLEVSPSQAIIKEDIELLQLFGPMQASETAKGYRPRIETFLSALEGRIGSLADLERWSPLIETVACAFPEAWLRLARWAQAQGELEKAMEACSRFLEASPDSELGWKMYAGLAKSTGDARAEAQALISHSRLRKGDLWEIFGDVYRLNELIQDLRNLMSKAERQALYASMLALLDRVDRASLNPTQLSRLAWLAIHAGQTQLGREYAELLERVDPESRFLPGLQNIY